ncbi:bifunctional adenosylcobinamide kinase/adenosylcobinamide-phosphate guanylyltransferase [Microbulbifer rhizosphaerae]|uniref:Bifunctional adenosylcobalamin biosynthesis protein n=1 Tax=Microbulbifer rhizosphaerae TaxID=1562603 RepID=A0A7W4WBK4_9GAMM|nr:bifunctional adenosylcobinamide kinase/adenosylcobinamide-phosphate guanylyltransferase [Microbulbifer rhizosphaerae]MBB3060546.1 adenosylcobinamide kinase/adenosylcobinamide-phosphate guanylyltransferase [Microbulbifer rhizosphaerae]
MQLILGGARSGKSRYAQERVEALGEEGDKKLIFLATAEARDGEMQKRIVKHRDDRGQRWQTCEEPLHLARALARISAPDTWVLVDCLTLWISNCLHAGCWEKERGQLLAEVDRRLATGTAPNWLFVSNEVGSGVVPLGQLSREFVDASGWLHQALAERCDQVTLVVAGLPLQLKG